jgi:hypothetical protein
MAYTYQSARVSIHFRTSAILNLGRGTHPVKGRTLRENPMAGRGESGQSFCEKRLQA